MSTEAASVTTLRAPVLCATCGERFPSDYRLCPKDGTPLADPHGDADPLLGTVLAGTYRLTRRLATGGMGRLYEAEHLRLERRYAIKVIHERYADRPDAVTRIEREARAAGRIRSDHVVDVVDVLRVMDGRPAIVATLLDGEDLYRRLEREGPLPLHEALPIARQVCRGLAEAHATGVVHRDLKPSNVFLAAAPDGRVSAKVLDFGVAKIEGAPDLTRTGAVVGTPSYMAPEQARGARFADERSDVYGVGAVLYHMLAGRPPYDGRDSTAVLARVLEGPPARLGSVQRDVPAALEAVIDRAMARDPAERIAHASDLEHQLALVEADLGPAPTTAPSALGDRPTSGDEPSTLILPAGSVAAAADLARRARSTRPLAVAVATALAAGIAFAVADLASALARSVAPVATTGERVLVATLTLFSLGAAAYVSVRQLRSRWNSAVAVEPWLRGRRHGLVASLVAFGGFELTMHGLAATGLATAPGEAGTALRVTLAALVGGTVALLARRARTASARP